MRRWGHMHSVGTGAIAGIYLAGHIWIALAVAFTLGIAVGRLWLTVRRGAHKAGSLLDARIATERERRANVRASRRVKLDRARASRAMLERAYRHGVIEGSLDATRK